MRPARPRPRRARVQRPLGRAEARPGRRDHRHLGPRPGPRLAAARADRRAGALRPRGRRRAHGPAPLGAQRARRPGARVPTAVHRRDAAPGRRPPALGAPRRPAARPAGRHAGPQPAGAARPARPLGRPPAPDARGGDDGRGAGLGARGRPGGAGRPRRLAGRQRRGDARRRARRTGRADRRRGRRTDVGRRPTTRSSSGSRSTTRSTTWPSWRPTASPATPRRTWSRAGGRTPSLDPLDAANDADSLDALLHSLGWSAVDPVGRHTGVPALPGRRRGAGGPPST